MNGKLIAIVFGGLVALGLIAALVGKRTQPKAGGPDQAERTAHTGPTVPQVASPPTDTPPKPSTPSETPAPRRRCSPEEWSAVKEYAAVHDRKAREDYLNQTRKLEGEYEAELQKSFEDPKRIHRPFGEPYEVDKLRGKLESHRRRNPESCNYVLRVTTTSGQTFTLGEGSVVLCEAKAAQHRAEELKVWRRLQMQSEDSHIALYVRWQVIAVQSGEVAAEWPDPLNPKLFDEGDRKKDEPVIDGATATTWVRRLADGTPAERRAAAAALGTLSLDTAVPHLIVAMLKDPEPEVRAQAARAAGRLGRGVRPADPDALAATFRLSNQKGMRKTAHPELLPALTAALSDPNTLVADGALDGLEELGPTFLHETNNLWGWNRVAVQQAIHQLLSMMTTSPERRVRARAAEVVSYFGPMLRFCRVDPVQVKAVVGLLSEKDRDIRGRAVQLVRDLGPVALAAHSHLLELSRDPNAGVAGAAAAALAAIAPNDEGTQAALARGIVEGAEPAAAGEALAACGVVSDDIRATLVECLKHGSSLQRRVVAAGVLGRAGKPDETVWAVLVEGLRSDRSEVVATAAAALPVEGPLPADVRDRLVSAYGQWKASNGSVRLHLAVALYNHQLGGSLPLTDLVRAAAQSQDATDRVDLARALALLKEGRGPHSTLNWLLKDESPRVRLAAAHALCRARPEWARKKGLMPKSD